MDFDELTSGIRQIWESKPGTIILLCLGGVLCLVLVIDTWIHRRRRKRPR